MAFIDMLKNMLKPFVYLANLLFATGVCTNLYLIKVAKVNKDKHYKRFISSNKLNTASFV